MIATTDTELRDWLLECQQSDNRFLRVLSHSVLQATEAEYALIRPSLVKIKNRDDARQKIRLTS